MAKNSAKVSRASRSGRYCPTMVPGSTPWPRFRVKGTPMSTGGTAGMV